MSRYIDANALLNPDNIIVVQDETGIDEFPYIYTNAVKVETILNAPTADVVEVVRCKDCKYQRVLDIRFCVCEHDSNIIITSNNPKRLHFIVAHDNHYCSYGERKEQ